MEFGKGRAGIGADRESQKPVKENGTAVGRRDGRDHIGLGNQTAGIKGHGHRSGQLPVDDDGHRLAFSLQGRDQGFERILAGLLQEERLDTLA